MHSWVNAIRMSLIIAIKYGANANVLSRVFLPIHKRNTGNFELFEPWKLVLDCPS